MSNHNRHKRHRSTANPQQFHIEEHSADQPQEDRPPSQPLHSRDPLLLLRESGRISSSNAPTLAGQSQFHGSYSIPSQVLGSSSSGYPVYPAAHMVPQLATMGHHQPPIPEFSAIPQDFSYASNFDVLQSLSSLGDQFLAQPDYGSHQSSRPHASSWVSAPEGVGHHKNVSISTHFDMFTLNEQAAPPSRQLPSQSSFPALDLFLESNRLPYNPLLRMSSAPPNPQPQLQHPPSLQESSRASHHLSLPHSRIDDNSTQLKLLRNIITIDAFNFNSYLLTVLKELTSSPPLDDFYNMLYNNENYTSYMLENGTRTKIDKSNSPPNSHSTEILLLILGLFRDPRKLLDYFPTLDMSGNKLASVNFHELLRSFLALKILFDSLVEVSGGSNTLELPTLPRLSIYKVYYILCQMLILKYPTDSNTTSLQQKLILGQSKVGKLIKLVYPNLLSKRLGRRGESKYNYLGVKWNSNIVDKEILELCEQDLPKLTEIFKNRKKLLDDRRRRLLSRHLVLSNRRPSIHRRQSTTNLPLMQPHRIRPPVTFIRSQAKFPARGFSPLSLVSDPGNIDPHTSWLGAARHHSLMALQDFNINWLIVRNVLLNEAEMAADENWLLNELTVKTQMILSSAFREEKEHLHLFLALAIDLLPTILVRDPLKIAHMSLVKKNLQLLAIQLGPRFAESSLLDVSDINAFVGVINRMVHLIGLLDSLFLSILDSSLLDAMRRDLDRLSLASEGTFEEEAPISRIKGMITQGMLLTINSYHFLQDEDGSQMSSERVIEIVQQDSTSLLSSLLESLARFLHETSSNIRDTSLISLLQLNSAVSKHLVDLVHSVVFRDNLVRHYSIEMIQDMVMYISNQLVTSAYQRNLNSNQGGAGPTFRHWWIVATYFQEYCELLGELVGLHESLT